MSLIYLLLCTCVLCVTADEIWMSDLLELGSCFCSSRLYNICVVHCTGNMVTSLKHSLMEQAPSAVRWSDRVRTDQQFIQIIWIIFFWRSKWKKRRKSEYLVLLDIVNLIYKKIHNKLKHDTCLFEAFNREIRAVTDVLGDRVLQGAQSWVEGTGGCRQ